MRLPVLVAVGAVALILITVADEIDLSAFMKPARSRRRSRWRTRPGAKVALPC